LSRFVISDRQPARAGIITWQLTQTFWVGGLWLLQFMVLPALGRIGLAPLLVEEIAGSLKLAGSQLLMQAGWFESLYWASFSYLVMALCGLMLVLQPAPGREL